MHWREPSALGLHSCSLDDAASIEAVLSPEQSSGAHCRTRVRGEESERGHNRMLDGLRDPEQRVGSSASQV